MDKILDVITAKVSDAFKACGYEESYGKVLVSNRPDLCEYQCNGAMAAAKAFKKAPISIANEVVDRLSQDALFEEVVSVMPGFINIKISGAFLAGYMGQMWREEKLGCGQEKQPVTIIVDYGGANVAKPLHVGHLRSAIIGESIKRLMRFYGNHVIGDVHLGDWGLQIGLVIEELKERKPELPYFDESYTGEYPSEAPFTISEFGEMYPAASEKSKTDEAFKARAQQATLKLQNGDPAYTALWNHIMNVSKPDLRRNYENLNVEFDLWKGESDAQPLIPGMVQDLIDRGIAYESQGAIVVDVAEDGDTKEIPPCLIRKSDGAALYATSDLATIMQREREYHPKRYIYMTDKRQELYFTQVFRAARKGGLVSSDCRLDFLGFGTMNGKDGKPFKTRDGGVMRLEYLIDDVNKAVYNKILENRTVSDDEAMETAKIISLAAVKYGDLSNQASKDYAFDVERFTSFEGNTGPYILYTIVRIKSILARYEENGGDLESQPPILPAAGEGEKSLMLTLANLQETLDLAYHEMALHKICQYIYELSNAFNSFYHNNKIISEENKERQKSWISLLKLTQAALEMCIDILGFKAPRRM